MKTFKLNIPGRFRDVIIYKGHLLLLQSDHSVTSANFSELVENLILHRTNLRVLYTYLFLRNDWLYSEQFLTLLSDYSVAESLFQMFERAEDSEFTEELPFSSTRQDAKVAARVITDWVVYYNRLYVATEKGLFDAALDVNNDRNFMSTMRHRHDAGCLSAAARYGTINVSCGTDGLFAAVENDYNNEYTRYSHYTGVPLKQVAPLSQRTSWLDYDIINYISDTEPALIKTTQQSARNETEERKVVSDIADTETTLKYVFKSESFQSKLEEFEENVEYVYNFVHHLFVRTDKNGFYGVQLKAENNKMPLATHVKRYKDSLSSVLNVEACRAGQIIETEDAVYLFSNNSLKRIYDGEVFAVRTFGTSRRYKNLVAIVGIDSVSIISTLDDKMFNKLRRDGLRLALA